MTDLAAARTFVHGHARLLERRRFQYGFDGASAEVVVDALRPYQNADGGFGALEPDLRTPASQPIATRYGLDVLAELPRSPAGEAMAHRALDWLGSITGSDGGVPFVLPSAAEQPAAPWLSPAPESSALMTLQLVAAARRLLPDHPWLPAATDYCWRQLAEQPTPDAITLRFAVDFLDTLADDDRTTGQLDELRHQIPADGRIPVAGGAEGEHVGPLEVAPRPDHAGCTLYSSEALDSALDELAAAQLDDGGFDFTWAKWNPAAAWEWRGIVTIERLHTVRAYGRL